MMKKTQDMYNYECIGSSDIARVILESVEVKVMNMSADDTYYALIVDENYNDFENYNLFFETTPWLKIRDDESIVKEYNADLIRVFKYDYKKNKRRNGRARTIIQLLNQTKEEQEQLNILLAKKYLLIDEICKLDLEKDYEKKFYNILNKMKNFYKDKGEFLKKDLNLKNEEESFKIALFKATEIVLLKSFDEALKDDLKSESKDIYNLVVKYLDIVEKISLIDLKKYYNSTNDFN